MGHRPAGVQMFIAEIVETIRQAIHEIIEMISHAAPAIRKDRAELDAAAAVKAAAAAESARHEAEVRRRLGFDPDEVHRRGQAPGAAGAPVRPVVPRARTPVPHRGRIRRRSEPGRAPLHPRTVRRQDAGIGAESAHAGSSSAGTAESAEAVGCDSRSEPGRVPPFTRARCGVRTPGSAQAPETAPGRDFSSAQGGWSPALWRPYSQSSRPSDHGRWRMPKLSVVSGRFLSVTVPLRW